MGFTGKTAMQWKEKYIAAFNQMERTLLAQGEVPFLLEDQRKLFYWLTTNAEGKVEEQVPIQSGQDLNQQIKKYFPHLLMMKREPLLEDLAHIRQALLQNAAHIDTRLIIIQEAASV